MLERFLDPIAATKDILKAYNDMEWKLEKNRKELSSLNSRMYSLGSPIGKDPVAGVGNSKEEALAKAIDRKTVLEKALKESEEYFRELEPALKRLTEEERFILFTRFIETDTGGVGRIMEQYNIERSEAYRRISKALKHLSSLLFV